MLKKVSCPKCGGYGFHIRLAEHRDYSEICEKCEGTDTVEEPMSNADKIREMSDTELAVFLDDVQRKECEALHLVKDDGALKFESCVHGWLHWLQEPAKEE